ncbi:hypothetical protein [Bartonella choladocola]|uniref:hypothetical protein n=1 Tax=Bartonella choladocola TaxID=2750995 RepID=UPI0009901964|nr:hypothetical protein [Bartonella choladocola]
MACERGLAVNFVDRIIGAMSGDRMFLATGGAASEAARRVADNGEFWQNGALLKKGGKREFQ